jgi:hypothetical protein
MTVLVVRSDKGSDKGIIAKERPEKDTGHLAGRCRRKLPCPFILFLKRFGKPIVCNEDAKEGKQGAKALQLCARMALSIGSSKN